MCTTRLRSLFVPPTPPPSFRERLTRIVSASGSTSLHSSAHGSPIRTPVPSRSSASGRWAR